MWVALPLLLAAPRLARIAYHQVWIEDESYLTGAFLMARGFLPYRDFPLPHLPALEGLLASVFLFAPASIRTAEIVTGLAAFVASVLVFASGRRLGGTLTGGFAAMIFATSALLFRYHVFEREVFTIVPVLGAMLVVSSRSATAGASATRAAIVAGLLLFTALAIKLTAIAPLAALSLQLRREAHGDEDLEGNDGRRRTAVITLSTTLALLASAILVLAAAFGTNFIVQVFVFRVVHAAFPSLIVKLDEMRYTLDISLALGAGGVALLLWSGQAGRWAGPLLQLLCGFIVLVLLNPTYWAHTGVELLPWLSLAGGYLLAAAWRCSFGRFSAREASSLRPGRAATLVCLGAAAVLLVFVTPIHNLNWQAGDGSIYGFGYRERNEIETLARFVREHAAADALVATPPIIAFAANRREVVPYAELAGEVSELAEIVRRDGYFAALTDNGLRHRSFWESVEASRDRMAPMIEAALATRRVAVVIDDSPDDLMPVLLTNVSPEKLQALGYQLESVSAHYEAWVPR